MDRLAYIYIYIPFISIFIYWIYESLYINLYIHRMEIFHNLDGCDHAIHLDSPGFIMEIWDLQLLIQIIFQLIVNPTSSESRYYSEIHYDGIRSILTNYIHIYIYYISWIHYNIDMIPTNLTGLRPAPPSLMDCPWHFSQRFGKIWDVLTQAGKTTPSEAGSLVNSNKKVRKIRVYIYNII
jgi:hypothetical protein